MSDAEKEAKDKISSPKVEQTEEKPDKNGEHEESSVSLDTSAMANDSINKSDEGNAGDNEQEESDSDESLPPGLLERPIEILKEKRVRKKIKRFNYDNEQTSPTPEKKRNAVLIPEGSGVRLGDHPRVEHQLLKNKAEDLKIIHKFFYGSPGDQLTCKKNIRAFCGFTFEKSTPEYEKKEEIIGRFTVDNLKWAMEVCDVPHSKGNKEELIETFMAWSMCPKPRDKPLPTIKKRGPKAMMKRSRKSEKSTDTEEKTPAKRGRKKKVDQPFKKKETNSSPKKSASQVTGKIKSKQIVDEADVSDDSDDVPLQKRKGPPTNDEIRSYVEKLLKGADLEVITMKSVFQQVYEQYPDYDLSDRKAFIKETVKKIIS